LSSERNWYRDQYDALDALVEALQTDNGWLEYRIEAMRDELLEHDTRAVEDASAIAKVRTALLEWDEALWKAREDLVGARTVAAEWETEVATTRAQLQQDCVTLEGARAWQSQAEEKAKEEEELRAILADKAASLSSTEERLQQEIDAHRQAEAQLQQERDALAEARAALERERLAREEAQGRLQQERAALEGAQATLKQRDEEVSRLNGELNQLSVSHEDLCQAVEEQEATVLGLQQAAEDARKALEVEKKQVKGESLFHLYFACPFGLFGIHSRFLFFVYGFQACGPPWGTRRPRLRLSRRPTTPRNRSWRSCGPLPSRRAGRSRRARRRLGARS
jgi:chromosome segregation ATPase